jgi:hypothetical protein
VVREPRLDGEVVGSNPARAFILPHILVGTQDSSVRSVPLVSSVGADYRVQMSIARHEFRVYYRWAPVSLVGGTQLSGGEGGTHVSVRDGGA